MNDSKIKRSNKIDERPIKRKKKRSKLDNDIEIELTEVNGKNDGIDIILEERIKSKKKCVPLKIICDGIFNTLTSSWLNIFLSFIPFSIIWPIFKWNQSILFLLSVLSLVALSSLMKESLYQVMKTTSKRLSNFIGLAGRNVIILILGLFCIIREQQRVLQATIVGNIILRTSLMCGFTYLPSFKEENISYFRRSNGITTSVMFLSCCFLLIPAGFINTNEKYMNNNAILGISRWASIGILIVYIVYCFFVLKTHPNFWDISIRQKLYLNRIGSILLLILCFLFVTYECNMISKTISAASSNWGFSLTFLSSIFLTISYNAVDIVKTIELSFKGRHTSNLYIISQSIIEINLFASSFLILLGWILKKDIGLNIFPYEGAIMFLFIIIFQLTSAHGRSNWLQGGFLIIMYIIYCLCTLFQPDHS